MSTSVKLANSSMYRSAGAYIYLLFKLAISEKKTDGSKARGNLNLFWGFQGKGKPQQTSKCYEGCGIKSQGLCYVQKHCHRFRSHIIIMNVY